MKAHRRLISVLVLLFTFVAGVFASGPIAKVARLAPLTGEDRETLISFYHRMADSSAWWSENYAMTDWERAYRLGEQHGLEFAAFYLETYRPEAHLSVETGNGTR